MSIKKYSIAVFFHIEVVVNSSHAIKLNEQIVNRISLSGISLSLRHKKGEEMFLRLLVLLGIIRLIRRQHG